VAREGDCTYNPCGAGCKYLAAAPLARHCNTGYRWGATFTTNVGDLSAMQVHTGTLSVATAMVELRVEDSDNAINTADQAKVFCDECVVGGTPE
jgi:hypothetical protein